MAFAPVPKPPAPAPRAAAPAPRPVGRPPAAPARAPAPVAARPPAVAARPPAPPVAARPPVAPKAAVAAPTTPVAPAGLSSDAALKSLQIKFYTLGVSFFEKELGKSIATGAVQAPAAKPAAIASAAPRPVGRPPGPAKVAAPAPAPIVQAAPAEGDDEYTVLNRKQLIDLAAERGVAVGAGLKADDIRNLLRNAGGGEVAATGEVAEEGVTYPEGFTEETVFQANTLIALIDENAEAVDPFINPESTEEGALRCGGDCMNCPNPEQHATPAEQVASCFVSLHQMLEREPPAYA